MALPRLPLLVDSITVEPTLLVQQNKENIDRLYSYLQTVIDGFANSVGEAIDPSQGEGGDGALTVDDVVSDITYIPGSSLSADDVLFGHIDITFTLPDRAVDLMIFYRRAGVDNFNVSYAPSSPHRISNLMVGETYEIQLAGRSANNTHGPRSLLTTLSIPTTGIVPRPSTDAEYIVGALHVSLTNERVVTDTATVTWDLSTPGQAKANTVAPIPPPQILTAVRKESDQTLFSLGNVTDMSFPVIAGHYYNIRFAIIAHTDATPADIAFAITTPAAPTAYAALGVI